MPKSSLIVALVGNPNTGKSTLFNALTGLRQHVGNYPGVTVELKKGDAQFGSTTLHFVDLPGTYSLAARSPDEMVTVDYILGHQAREPRPDVVVSIVDACNLDRHLFLASQILNLGVPLVIAVNLIDVASKNGLQIDFAKLGKQLGLSVVPIQANRGRGSKELREAIVAAASAGVAAPGPNFPDAFQEEAACFEKELPEVEPFLVQRLLLDVGGYTESVLTKKFGESLRGKIETARTRLTAAGCGVPAVEAKTRYAWIRQKLAGCVVRPATRPVTFSDRLDHLLTHKIWGSLIFLAMMFLVFEAIFIWASPLMQLIDSGKKSLADLASDQMAAGPLRSLIADGIIQGVGSVLIFLPQILILFGFISVLEDCGYMARAAFLMDKIMSKCGLNGKSFIPMLSSVACAVPGIMATRVIENRRDRLTTILAAPVMSCSARLPVYMLLIGVFLSNPWWLPGVALFGMYMLGLIVAPLVALTLKRTLLRGATPIFVMEMPSFKCPQAKTVIRRMIDAGWAFVYRAGTFIFASMILIWALLYFPNSMPDGRSFENETERLRKEIDDSKDELAKLNAEDPKPEEAIAEKTDDSERKQGELDALNGDWKRQSLLGRAGKTLEPAFAPLGWDWRIGMAALASFPAREVVVGTLGMIYNQGDVDPKSIREAENPAETPLGQAVQKEWRSDTGSPAPSIARLSRLGCSCFTRSAASASPRWPSFDAKRAPGGGPCLRLPT